MQRILFPIGLGCLLFLTTSFALSQGELSDAATNPALEEQWLMQQQVKEGEGTSTTQPADAVEQRNPASEQQDEENQETTSDQVGMGGDDGPKVDYYVPEKAPATVAEKADASSATTTEVTNRGISSTTSVSGTDSSTSVNGKVTPSGNTNLSVGNKTEGANTKVQVTPSGKTKVGIESETENVKIKLNPKSPSIKIKW